MKDGRPKGLTLVEIMIALALIGVGVLAFFNSFRFIARSLHVSRTRTLATNLAQEKVEIVKNLGYYQLLITTAPAIIPFSSDAYDTSNYPPESITVSGITFTRYTYVTLAEVHAGVITSVGYSYPDTGMKRVTVTVAWSDQGQPRRYGLSNLVRNLNAATLDSGLSGTVARAGGGTLAGAVVEVEQNSSWYSLTAADGSYAFSVSHGSYTVRASSAGYYDSVSAPITAPPSATAALDFVLTPISSGSVTGKAWFNPGLVISQVVGTTTTAAGVCGGPQDVEYVELFNPTTAQIAVARSVGAGLGPGQENLLINTQIGPMYHDDIMGGGGASTVYVSSYVKPGGYFLVASHPSFMVNGNWITADAYYNNGCSPPNAIANHSCGSVQLASSDGDVIDQVCWQGDSCFGVSLRCEGARIPTDPDCGLNTGIPAPGCQTTPWAGDQLVRFSRPAVLGRGAAGSAYDAGNNATDFMYPQAGLPSTVGLNWRAFSSTSPALPVLSGVPAIGAEIAAADAFSGCAQAAAAWTASPVGPQLYASFALPGVATGTWSVAVATVGAGGSVFFAQVDGVPVAAGGTTALPDLVLTSTVTGGFIKGEIDDASGMPLSGIKVIAGGVPKTTGANGSYFALVSTGIISVVANPDNANPAYVQQQEMPLVTAAGVTIQDFVLLHGGALLGYVTTGTTPLPNILVVATADGSEAGAAASDAAGYFTIRNIPSGTYSIAPAVPPGQAAIPSALSATLGAAPSVWVGSFTVLGALGTISGTVRYNGSVVTSGALIVASTSAISVPPSPVAGSSCTAMTPTYAISSLADGTYILPVRAASGYRLMVAMPRVDNQGNVTIFSKTYSGISVNPSAATTKNLDLP